MSDKIITVHVYPPIPWRHFDWCAHQGHGATEDEAIADLLMMEEE